MLSRWKMRPEAVDGGVSALARLHEAATAGRPFPLVLLDSNMPGMDGFTLASRIREDPLLTDTTLVVLTSAGRENSAQWGTIGVAACATKPVRQAELYSAVVEAIGARSDGPLEMPIAAPVAASPDAGRSLRILLAEDNPVNRKIAIAFLEKRGHVVTVAENGQIAVRAGRARDVRSHPHGCADAGDGRIRRHKNHPGARARARWAHPHPGADRAGDEGRPRAVSRRGDGQLSDQAVPGRRALCDGGCASSPLTPTPGECRRTAAATILERFLGDRELLSSVAQTFVARVPVLLDELDDAVTRGDADAVQRAAHSLKGSAGNFGHGPSFEAAAALERLGRSGDLGGVVKAHTAVKATLSDLVALLDEWTVDRETGSAD